MKIVLLDAEPCNPGDMSWAPFEALGEVTAYPFTRPEQVAERCRGAAIVINNKTPLPAETLAKLPDVKYIGLLSTGTNVVDVKAAKERGMTVTFVPAYSTGAVAQHTFALLLELTNHVGAHSNAVRAGRWQSCGRFCFWDEPLTELTGKTFGIVGMGNIGKAVAAAAAAFGMQVLYTTRTPQELPYEAVSLDELLARADVLSLHCPLTERTRRLISRQTLAQMKPGALLLNTARGELLDEEAVAEALTEGRLGGAAVDVLCAEPPTAGSPLITAPRCVITPHLAWAAKETRRRLIAGAAENLAAYLAGRPIHVAEG